ncbi:MAG: glutamine--fructose-6-phosphate transaminase (isomerizing) [Thermomicrobiales bacterium]|nr:glutamine--fructose-6-phosphate transaminase (isomerizing) [Thermomicrobiales bacterium]
MCGVFGYVGEQVDLGSDLLRGLRTLEYRGYDSWGVALGRGRGIDVVKRVGRVHGDGGEFAPAEIGFGHTRWATHGGVTDANAHPHLDCAGHLAVIHNGIIDNHRDLRSGLIRRGHRFRSETDSEVVAHLMEEALLDGGDLGAALAAVFARLGGLNAVVVMDARTREMAAVKRVSPLVAGVGPSGAFIASDALALRPHADRAVYLEDGQLLRMTRQGLALFDAATLHPLPLRWAELDCSVAEAALGAYPHFMIKEIAEQPAVIERLVERGRAEIEALAEAIAEARATALVGCGTAANAALTGRYLFARIAGVRLDTVVGAEFAAHAPFVASGDLVIALSQSGETADLIEAALIARAGGARLAAIVNVKRSTLDRMVDLRLHLGAGPEQCVLATKSYTAKVAALLLAAHAAAGDYARGAGLVRTAAEGLREMLREERVAPVREAAARIRDAGHMFVIGRGLAYPSALEAALKIKEVSYIHAEGFASGELKHGVIALIEPGTPCLIYAPNDETRADVLSGAMELKSRGGFTIGVGPEPDPLFDIHLPTPDVGDAAPIVNALPAQLLGYHVAMLRGHDPDRPRNLAKSVTVK